MQTRHNAYRTNAATKERVSDEPGEAFTRKEAYLSLLALVSGLVLNTMPSSEAVNDWAPNDVFGTIISAFYVFGWWLVLFSAVDALLTTVFASVFRVVPSVMQTTLIFSVGIWLTFLFWACMFAYDASDSEIDYAERTGAPQAVHVIKAIAAFLIAVVGIPFLMIIRYVQYTDRIRLPRPLVSLVDVDGFYAFQPQSG